MEEGVLEYSRFDNNFTLLYKAAANSGVPVRLMIVRSPRDEDGAHLIRNRDGTLVFEAVTEIISEAMKKDEEGNYEISGATDPDPAELYSRIENSSKGRINDRDIVMQFFMILNGSYDLERNRGMRTRVLASVNEFYQLLDPTISNIPFDSFDSLLKDYAAYSSGYQDEIRKDMEKLDSINNVENELTEYSDDDRLDQTPVDITTTVISFQPFLNERKVEPEDGLDIFNEAVPTHYIPYIRYNDSHGNSYYKVYTGSKMEDSPNYSVTVIPNDDSKNNDTIYMTLWMGKGNVSDMIHSAKGLFFTIIYYLPGNFLSIRAPAEHPKKKKKRLAQIEEKSKEYSEREAVKRAKRTLPFLDFRDGKEVKVGGSFDLMNFEYDEDSLLYCILNEPVMSVYLYVEENVEAFAFKKRLDIHYRSILSDEGEGTSPSREAYISNYASVSVTVTQKFLEEEQEIKVLNKEGKKLITKKYKKSTPYLHLAVTQADSYESLQEFVGIFNLLLLFYKKKEQDGLKEYLDESLSGFGDLQTLLSARSLKEKTEQSLTEIIKQGRGNRKADSRINQLKKEAPELFIEEYARRCQCHKQPMIISPSEVDEWSNKQLPSGEKRQVMLFPRDDAGSIGALSEIPRQGLDMAPEQKGIGVDKWYFVCPSNEDPYPGLKSNTTLSNKKKYPYIPCCFGSDQNSNNPQRKISDFINYMLGNDPGQNIKGAKAKNPIETGKLLAPGRAGYLPKKVDYLLSKYSDRKAKMRRIGVIYTPNSLIHAACVAVQDEKYFELESEYDRERYATGIRKKMLELPRGLFKQEMFDYSDEEIEQYIRDNNRFLDPAFFYRGIEELFNVNLFVFVPYESDNSENDLGTIEVPRHKLFHSRPPRLDRRTMLILKTWAAERDSLEYQECDLIVDRVDEDDENEDITLFGVEMTELCNTTLENVLTSVTWNATDRSIVGYQNEYSRINHADLFSEGKIISQSIDLMGKVRSFNISFRGMRFTLFTIPSQPEKVKYSKTIYRPDPEDVVRILGAPSGKTVDRDGRIDGFWYPAVGITFAEYIPVAINDEIDIDIPVGPTSPAQETSLDNQTKRLMKLRRDLTVILQLIKWVYEIYKGIHGDDYENFIGEYFVVEKKKVLDSAQYYDLSLIKRHLPMETTVNKALRYIESLAPSLSKGGKFIMYDNEFGGKIRDAVEDYHRLRFGSRPNPPKMLEGFFTKDSDFIQYPDARIFIGDSELSLWLTVAKASRESGDLSLIKNKMEVKFSNYKEPYLFQDDTGKIYLVQNVLGGSKERALMVSLKWKRKHINLGSDPSDTLDEVPAHIINGISVSSTLVMVSDNTGGSDEYIEILYYGTAQDASGKRAADYAALLELL